MKKKIVLIPLNLFLGHGIRKLIVMYGVFLAISLCGCKKFVEIEAPVTSINSANIYNTDFNAAAVLTGIYTSLSEGLRGGGLRGVTLFTALSSDELILYGGRSSLVTQYIPYYMNSLTRSNGMNHNADIYNMIYTINSAIEGLTASHTLTPSVKQQLLGEAKFMRGFCYFYLVNLYGDVPLVLTTDYKVNSIMAKSPKSVVYTQMIADLKDAQVLLSDKYLKADVVTAYAPGSEERVRPTKWAATALLARVYIYNKNWDDAEREASIIIGQSSLYQLTEVTNTFLKNNSEAIWQLQPTYKRNKTEEASNFVLLTSGPSTSGINFYLSKYLMDRFEPGDLRRNTWTNHITVKGIIYNYSFKYKVIDPDAEVSEYPVVLRLAEQYLLRAEARIQNGDIGNGIADLNVIRNRASDQTLGAVQLPQLSGSLNKEDALKAVLHERQIELFMEWGHRWFDLKRMGYADEVMTPVTKEKGGTWNSRWQLYPFSEVDLQRDPNLIQNEGY